MNANRDYIPEIDIDDPDLSSPLECLVSDLGSWPEACKLEYDSYTWTRAERRTLLHAALGTQHQVSKLLTAIIRDTFGDDA